MSLLTSQVIPAIENRLPKVIDARTHGIIDYCHAAFFLTLGFISLKNNKGAAAASLMTGSLVLVQSLLTDYPLGVKPVFSFEEHGRIDALFASASWAMPRLFGFSGTPQAHIFQGNSLVEATVVGLTDFNNQHARDQETA